MVLKTGKSRGLHLHSKWELGIDTSYHQVLRAQCFPPRCRPPTLLNTDKGRLCQIWFSPVAKQVERHHSFLLAYRCAIITCFLNFFDFFDFFDSGSHSQLPINHSSFPRHPNTYRRSPWTIRTTDACFHKLFPMSLSPYRCRPYLDLRREEAWQGLAIRSNCMRACNR